MTTLRFLLPLSAALAYACANLPAVAADVCGNRVVEPTEDCDSFGVGTATCGAPGTTNACRLLCNATADCPAGWGCGLDKICRAPSGTFTSAFDPVASGQARLQLGDFDGDGRLDVLASSVTDADQGSVYYFSDDAQIAATLPIEVPMRSPQVVRFGGTQGDALDDVVFVSTTFGIDALLGQKDRTMIPVAYPTPLPDIDVTVFPLIGSPAKGELPLELSGVGVGVVVGRDSSKRPIMTPLTSGGAELTSTLKTPPGYALTSRADIVDGLVAKVLPGSLCGELVLLVQAPTGAPEVDLIPLCAGGPGGAPIFNTIVGAPSGPPPQRFDLTALGVAKATPISLAVGDLDGDKAQDIVVNVTTQAGAIAHNPFLITVKTGVATELRYTFKDIGGMAHDTGSPSPILATGDFNGDGTTDFATADDVLTSSKDPLGKVTYFAVAHNPGDSWAQVLAADLNGDGAIDLAAISSERTSVDFFVGTQSGFFSTGTLAATGVLTRLSSGDYDGDGVTDLGMLARPSADAAGGDVLVAYGQRQGLPTLPARVASFALANDLPTLPNFAVDLLSVIGNTTGSDGLPLTDLALLVGDADRSPIASKSLSALSQINKADLTNTNAVGVFAGALKTTGLTDVGTFFGNPQSVSTSGAGIAFAPALDQDFQGNLGDFSFVVDLNAGAGKNPLLGAATSAPRDADGGASAVPAGPSASRTNRYLANASVPIALGDVNADGLIDVFVVNGAVGGPSATLARVGVSGGAQGLTTLVTAPQPFGVAGKVKLVDVDGDGALDLVYVSGFDSVTPGRSPGENTTVKGDSVLTVFFNDGKGNLATSGVPLALTVQNASAAPAACTTFANATDIASIGAQAGPARSLAVLTAQCLYVATVDRSGKGMARSLLSTALTVGFSLVAGDMTGDGVEDLAFLDDRNFSVLQQAPVRK